MPPTTTKPQPKADTVKSDPIAFLGGLNHGQFPHAIAEKLDEVVTAVRETGKRGRLTIEIDFMPEPKMGEHALRVEANLDKSKTPRPSPKSQFRFATDDGRLVLDDPNQLKFKFQEGDAAGE